MTAEPAIGHNSAISKEALDRLASIIERIENLEEQKSGLSEDISEIKKEAKSAGFDAKALNAVLKMRKKDANEIVSQTMLVETYARALGMASYLE
jgi:uncharacterized protein (UPF0335 family)